GERADGDEKRHQGGDRIDPGAGVADKRAVGALPGEEIVRPFGEFAGGGHDGSTKEDYDDEEGQGVEAVDRPHHQRVDAPSDGDRDEGGDQAHGDRDASAEQDAG